MASPAQLAECTREALRQLLRAVLRVDPARAAGDLPPVRDALIARLIDLIFARRAAARGPRLPASGTDLPPLSAVDLRPVHAALAFVDALAVDELGAVYESSIGLTLVRDGDAVHLTDAPGERRRSGAHYTPRALGESIVATALAPVLAALGERPTLEQLLAIQLCDPAMGAGAFLLAACRQLAAHLERTYPGADALRLVARHCIHGVDRDPLAVRVARHSLALLADDVPDSFAANLRHGDSLVGLPGPLDDPRIRTFFAADPRPVHPLHWPHAFPRVFARDDPGFDCIVGNPPFLGGKRVRTLLGERTRDWLALLHGPGHGNADLAAHFFRRAFTLLRRGGTLGFIATNTITQGDTVRAGLAWICQHGTIYAARTRVPWPGAASVMACVVHAIRGPHPAPRLDDRPVARISAFLLPGDHDEIPAPLAANRNTSFTGCDLKGPGFTFDDTTPAATPISVMHQLLADDPRNAMIVRPYLGGEELNTHPRQSPHRHVIHFGDRPLADAAAWPALLKIVEERVAPQRRAMSRELARWPWWQFWRTRPRLRAAIRDLPRVLVNAQVTAHLAFVFMPADLVFAHTLNIFAFADDASFAVLQSRVHEVWARAFASTLEDRLRYTPSDCFNNYPLPDRWQSSAPLLAAGRAYHDLRADLMRREDLGLTALYNRFHAPDDRSPAVATLREYHAALDHAVLAAYGWHDLAPACEFRRDPAARRPRLAWPPALAREVLARLLARHRERSR